jgi:acyl carrier protein
MADRTQTAASVYEILVERWPGRFGNGRLADGVSLGEAGLGLDSIEIVELVLDCEHRLARPGVADTLLDAGPISLGRLIDRLAR